MPALTQTPFTDILQSSYINKTIAYTTPNPPCKQFELIYILAIIPILAVIWFMILITRALFARGRYRDEDIEHTTAFNSKSQGDVDFKRSFKNGFTAIDGQFDCIDEMILRNLRDDGDVLGFEGGIKSGEFNVFKVVSKDYEVRDKCGKLLMAGGEEERGRDK